jgi:hypothetical protein
VNKKYHIEVFDYNMLLTGQKLTSQNLTRQQTALLFDYTAESPVCQRIELDIGAAAQENI